MHVEFNGKRVVVIKCGIRLEYVYPNISFKEQGDGTWLSHSSIFSEEEKVEVLSKVNKHFKWYGNKFTSITLTKVANEIPEMWSTARFDDYKLVEEVDEFIAEAYAPEFNESKAIDELWDVFTVMTNQLQRKGVNVEDIFKGFDKNMDKRINRGYKFDSQQNNKDIVNNIA